MRSVTRSLRTGLIVTAAASMPVAFGVGVAADPSAAAPVSMNDRAKFAGAYALVTTEVKDAASGTWSQTPNFDSIGYITYSDTGHMGVHIMPKIRMKFASTVPTGEEAQAALRGYTAYFGSYTVDDKDKFVVHHRVGQINPGGELDAKRFYDFVATPAGGERLILTPAPADGSGKDKATIHLIWQRLPNAPLSAEAKKFPGFYKLLYTDSYRTKDGKEVFHGDKVYTRAGTSYIIYTPTGHMMVHLMDKEGRTKYAAAQPTPDEALKAYRSYNGYFGRFVTYENETPRFVIHSQQGTMAPGGYSDQQRFYEFTGNVLRLGAPPSHNPAGEVAGGHLYWQKLAAGEK
ncbi:MAG: hypothetical protein EXQ59_04910 [Acidobacteria bacterium]|nr:hypothetical protein [Acidobacteriota bacterium]